jgi:hypothetical protein
MNKPIRKWVIAVILILFMAYSGFATYNWLRAERVQAYALNDVIHLADYSLVELGDMGLGVEYLIKLDTTDELLRETIIRYSYDARTLSYASRVLRDLAGDGKYSRFETAMRNLQLFLADLSNERPDDMKEILTTNLDTMKQMGDRLEGVFQIDYLTLADATELLGLSRNLTVG